MSDQQQVLTVQPLKTVDQNDTDGVSRLFKIKNSSLQKIVYKLKTNNSKKFAVDNSMGVLSAGEETIVKVKLLNKHSDDKFLIQSYNVTDDMPHCSALDVWSQVREKDVFNTKFVCNFSTEFSNPAPPPRKARGTHRRRSSSPPGSGGSVSLYSKPYRDVGPDPWSKKTREELKAEIVTHDLTQEAGIDYINVLLIGEIGAGKSSFFNSVESVFKGRVARRANAGTQGQSLTTQYRQYFVSDGIAVDAKNRKIRFKFCDSMGLEGEDGLTSSDMAKIMDGYVENMAELTGKAFIKGCPGYKENPTDNDTIHCVVLFVNAQTFSVMDENLKMKIKDIRKEADSRHLYPLVVLTKIDKLCTTTEEDTTKVFSSRAVDDKIQEISEELGILPNMIQPIRNYNTQVECNDAMDILILRALRQILRYSQDYLEDKIAMRNESQRLFTEEAAKRGFKPKDEKADKPKEIIPILRDGKKWKITYQTALLGAPGKVKVQPGDIVVEVEAPDEDGYVLVETDEGKVGSIAVNCAEEIIKKMMRVTQEKKLIGTRGVVVAVGDILEQVEPPDEDGLVSVKTASGETGMIKSKYLEPRDKVLKIKTRQRLIGCAGKVYLEPGDSVYEVDPEEDGMVNVRTSEGDEGSIPVAAIEVTAKKKKKTQV